MRVPTRYSYQITIIPSFLNSLAMFVLVLLAACWYYPSTHVCLLLELYTAHCTLLTAYAQCTVHTTQCTLHRAQCKLRTAHCPLRTGGCTVHTALRDAWCQNSKFCNKGRHSMNWRDRRGSVNYAKSSSSFFFRLQYFVCKHFHLCCGEGVSCRLRRLVLFQIIPVFTLLPFLDLYCCGIFYLAPYLY